MKHRALFSSKDKSKKLKCRLLQFLFGPLGVKFIMKVADIIDVLVNKHLLKQLLNQHHTVQIPLKVRKNVTIKKMSVTDVQTDRVRAH